MNPGELENTEIENNKIKRNPNFQSPSYWALAKISIPNVFSQVLSLMEAPIMLGLLGNSKSSELVPVLGLGVAISSITVLSSIVGVNSSMDTFMNQSVGREDYKNVNDQFNKTRLTITILFGFLQMILLNIPDLLKHMDYDYKMVLNLNSIMCILGIAHQFKGNFDLIRRQFVCLGQVNLPFLINFVCILVHLLICQILIIVLDMGLFGAAISLLSTNLLTIILSFIFISQNKILENYNFINRYQIPENNMLYLCFWSVLALMQEWWVFELFTVLVGSLGNIELTVQTLIFQLISTLFMVSLGISSGSSQLIGASISAKSTYTAKIYAFYSFILHFVLIVPVILIIQLQPKWFMSILTNDKYTIDYFEELQRDNYQMLIYFDTLNGVFGGILRGLGLQDYSIQINMIYWIYSIPITYYNVQYNKYSLIKDYQYFNIGVYLNTLGYLIVFTSFDWSKCGDIYGKINNNNDHKYDKKKESFNNFESEVQRENDIEIEDQYHHDPTFQETNIVIDNNIDLD